jgi:CHAT domain-containing protein
MSAWTLIAHPDVEVRKEVERTVQEVLNAWPGRIVHASHADGAGSALFQNEGTECRLIVTGVALPQDGATPLSESGSALGVKLARQVRTRELEMPIVFTAERADGALRDEVQALWPSAFVPLNTQWAPALTNALSDARRGAAAMRRPRALNLDMELLNRWNWRLFGDGLEDGGEIYVDTSVLESVQDWSRAISRDRSGQTWEASLNSIRKALNDLFFRPSMNQKLNSGLLLNIGKFGAENARVRFTVDERTHELLLEALQDPENSQPSFWMLKAPIYRRYDRTGAAFPLFKDRVSRQGEINCLIVAADPAECALGEPWSTPLEELPQLMKEVEGVTGILEREKAERGGVGRLEVFRAADHPRDAADALAKLLEQGPWHLVHFAGHAVRSGNAGALVLGGAQGAVLPVDALAGQLAEARTQFLYLSSCKSADAYFVMRLVERRLPAVLGFRWPVKDEKALKCARDFYQALFEKESSRKYLEYALLNAKRELHKACAAEPTPDSTWAAPVLVMQVDRAQDDSQVLAGLPGIARAASHAGLH